MKRSNLGFTLIGLLVVIAIIGALSSVVLAALNSSRDKSANAAIKQNLANARAQAEIHYEVNNGSYNPNVCANTTTGINKFWTAVDSINGSNAVICDRNPGGTQWVIQAELKTDEGGYHYWCVDNTGVSKGNTAAQPYVASSYVCP
jgi:type II secretory pathway pseudopilin PulG